MNPGGGERERPVEQLAEGVGTSRDHRQPLVPGPPPPTDTVGSIWGGDLDIHRGSGPLVLSFPIGGHETEVLGRRPRPPGGGRRGPVHPSLSLLACPPAATGACGSRSTQSCSSCGAVGTTCLW